MQRLHSRGDVTETGAPAVRAGLLLLRGALLMDALTFLTAAALNLGARIPLGVATLQFPTPTVQAGVGEAVIGAALLLAGLSMNLGLAWVALWLSGAGIALGLVFTSREGGPAFDVHQVMAPLAVIVLGLLLRARRTRANRRDDGPAPATAGPDARQLSRTIGALMLVAAATLLAASAIHFGLSLPLGPVTLYDPFAGAAVPEAVLGVALTVGVAFVLTGWSGRWAAAVPTALFALLLTLYGLSITVSGGRTGDVVYHLVLLGMLVILVGLLLSPPGRRALRA